MKNAILGVVVPHGPYYDWRLEECVTSIYKLERISELGTFAVTNTVTSKIKIINRSGTVSKITYYKKICDSDNINISHTHIPCCFLLQYKKLEMSVLYNLII
jgi:hypothetical protein